MKRILLCWAVCVAITTNAQELRYFHEVFDSVRVIRDIPYGENYVYDATEGEAGLTTEVQTLDIYLPPTADTIGNRPLIIWAHGGSFLNGSKEDADIVHFCESFTRRGFVCASINYRLGYEQPIDSVNAFRAVYRALQDGRAAVRFMRFTASDYGIDPDRIYFGGTSAGALIALNIVYLNRPEEIPAYLDTNERLSVNTIPGFGLDGIEGLTNQINTSSEIAGIINFCGATRTVEWMNDEYARNTPVISMHGPEDGTVPYGTRVINVNDIVDIPEEPVIPIIEVQGSYDIDRHADTTGIVSRLYTWYGADHVPYIDFLTDDTAQMYMDTLMSFTVKHVYEDFLGLGEVPGLEENEPPCDFNNGDTQPCTTTGMMHYGQTTFSLAPNPARETVRIYSSDGTQATMWDALGQIIWHKQLNAGQNNISVRNLPAGLYVIQAGGQRLRLLVE